MKAQQIFLQQKQDHWYFQLLCQILQESLLQFQHYFLQALQQLDLAKAGYHNINDIVACPGTDTCNLGIASSMGLAAALQSIIENEYPEVIEKHNLNIKISGCMNACGQHAIADIGFQGMTVKSNGNIAPAT